ncbi:hypothetical protein [Caballeronia terrestris]|jgi:hypothetical protein|nr:hypothetical protein [Caballeronia terrestris]
MDCAANRTARNKARRAQRLGQREEIMHRAIYVMQQSFFNLGCFYRVDIRSRSGRLIESHYVELCDIAWC